MTIKILQIIGVIIACVCVSQMASAQTNANGLAVSAEASLLADTNRTRLVLTIHLLNTTTNEMTVLTKHVNYTFDFSGPKKWDCTLGYNRAGTKVNGDLASPPRKDFSPVTLKPNQVVAITQIIDEPGLLANLSPDTEITVHYVITPEWGKHFKTWSGSAQSPPFLPKVKTAH